MGLDVSSRSLTILKNSKQNKWLQSVLYGIKSMIYTYHELWNVYLLSIQLWVRVHTVEMNYILFEKRTCLVALRY